MITLLFCLLKQSEGRQIEGLLLLGVSLNFRVCRGGFFLSFYFFLLPFVGEFDLDFLGLVG